MAIKTCKKQGVTHWWKQTTTKSTLKIRMQGNIFENLLNKETSKADKSLSLVKT